MVIDEKTTNSRVFDENGDGNIGYKIYQVQGSAADASTLTFVEVNISTSKIKNKPINPHPFQYVYNAENACPHENLHLVVLVKSRASNTVTRDVIRKTWGIRKTTKGFL